MKLFDLNSGLSFFWDTQYIVRVFSKLFLHLGVRRYIKEALMGMIRIHAEIYSVSPRLVPRVMRHVVEAVVDELCRLIQCVMGFNRNGALQVNLIGDI